MAASYKLIFNRNGRLNRKNEGLINIEVYFNRKQRRFINTGKRVKADDWDKKRNCVRSSHNNHVKLNNYFRNLINDFENFELDCSRDGKTFNWPVLKEFFLKKNNINVEPITFNKFAWKNINDDVKLAAGTLRHNKVTMRLFDEFKNNCRFDELTTSLIKKWDSFLHSKKFKHNTISKHHKVIVKYINIAIEDERIEFTRNDFPYTRSINKSFKRTRNDFLRLQELDRIEKLKITDKWMDIARTRLLVSCYTGLRHSDINQLSLDILRFYDEGFAIDLKEMQKTKDNVYYPCWQYFNGKAEHYIKKLAGDDFLNFKRFYDDNKYLKHLAIEADLNRPISFHIGRHSFLTNLAYEVNGNVLKVMRYGGIRSIDTAMIYIHAAEEYYEHFNKKPPIE